MPEVSGNAAIDYAENGRGSVAAFTATDPEGRMIHWSLLATPGDAMVDGAQVEQEDIADFGDFSISAGGALTFNISPDHESPADDGGNNEYNIVVVASDDAPGAGGTMGYKKVVVTVTDVTERGMVSLTSLQPQVDVELTASLIDPEVTDVQISAATWKWSSPGAGLRVGRRSAAAITICSRRTLRPAAITYGRRRHTRTPMIITGPRRECRSTRCGRPYFRG